MNQSSEKALAIGLRKILVPTDFSTTSKRALPYVVSLAKQFGASLTVLYAVPTHLLAALSPIGVVLEEKRLVAEAWRALGRFREEELPRDLKVDLLVTLGRPYERVCEAAKTLKADLIITATHGHTGLKHLWLGSTAERIVRHASCPVLTVRPRWMRMRVPNEPEPNFTKILVPVDFSEASRKALYYAASFAREFGGVTNLLHVIEPPPYPEFGYAHVALKGARRKQAAKEHLERLRIELPLNAALRTTAAVRTGNAFREIVSEATATNADLIILATHGHTGLAHTFLGSTAENVVRHAPCPVLVVREREHEFIP